MQKTMIRRAALFLLLPLMACATPYQVNGLTTAASEEKLDENNYIIIASGNAYSSDQRIDDFTMLHAAEVTLHDGFRYFSVRPKGIYDAHWDLNEKGVHMPTPSKKIRITLYRSEGEAKEPLFDAALVKRRLGAKYIKEQKPD